MQKGYIKLYRCMIDKGWSKDPEYVALWVYLLMRTSYNQQEVLIDGAIKILNPGQLMTSRKQISINTGINESKIERILKLFKNEQQIEQQTFSKYRVISIVNWHKFQASEQQIEQQMNSKRTADEQQMNTYKKEEEIKEKIITKKFIPPSELEVKAYMAEIGFNGNAAAFIDYNISRGWVVGKSKMKDWKAAVRIWKNNDKKGVTDESTEDRRIRLSSLFAES